MFFVSYLCTFVYKLTRWRNYMNHEFIHHSLPFNFWYILFHISFNASGGVVCCRGRLNLSDRQPNCRLVKAKDTNVSAVSLVIFHPCH